MRCRFKHKIFQNEENGYTIAIFTTQDTSVPLSARDKYLASRNIIGFSAIGFGLPLTDEIELEMEGRWESGEHGTQYQVENFMEVVPRTKEGILGYLSSGAVKGIGPKMADTIFRKFGLQTLEIMENNPQELLKIRGISEKKLAAIVESYGKNQVFRELMTFLAPFKVTPKKVNMILKKFGNESVDIIRHRPYMLSAVKGLSCVSTQSELLIRIISGMIYISSDLSVGRMMLETINNMMLELYASMAQAELEKKEKRQREGIEAKKLRGEWDDYGRPSVMKQETFDENFQSVVSGETTPTQLRKNLGMTHSTFYRYRKTFYEKYPELSNSAN